MALGSQEHRGGAGGGGVALRGRGLLLQLSLRQRATLVSHRLKPWADWVQPRPSAGPGRPHSELCSPGHGAVSRSLGQVVDQPLPDPMAFSVPLVLNLEHSSGGGHYCGAHRVLGAGQSPDSTSQG